MSETWGAPSAARESDEDTPAARPAGDPAGSGSGRRFCVDDEPASLVEVTPPPARVWARIEATLREEGRIRGS